MTRVSKAAAVHFWAKNDFVFGRTIIYVDGDDSVVMRYHGAVIARWTGKMLYVTGTESPTQAIMDRLNSLLTSVKIKGFNNMKELRKFSSRTELISKWRDE